jgi:hypothetical protein
MNQRIGQDEAPESRPNLRTDDGTVFIYNSQLGVYEPYKRSDEDRDAHSDPAGKQSRFGFGQHWQKHWGFWITTLLSIVTLVVLGLYTYFAGRQTKASEDAVKETRNAVNVASDTLQHTKDQEAAQAPIDKESRDKAQAAADGSAKLAQNSIQATTEVARQDQRAWVGLENMTVTSYRRYPAMHIRTEDGKVLLPDRSIQMAVDLKMRNFGRSAAQHIQIYPELLLTTSPDLHRNDPGCKSSYPASDAGYTLLPTQPLKIGYGLVLNLPPGVVAASEQAGSGGLLLRVLGCIVYSDSVSKKVLHHTPFSYALNYNGSSFIPYDLSSSDDGDLWKAEQLTIDPGPAD